MRNEDLNRAAADACAAIDWSLPQLKSAKESTSGQDPLELIEQFTIYLRGRERPRFVHTPQYCEELRRAASPSDREKAAGKVREALDQSLLTDAHRNAVSAVGAETLLLSLDGPLCEQLAANVLAARAKWDQGPWGVTRSICELIAVLLVLPECPGQTLAPLFAWLNAQLHDEWRRAREWDESMLGNSGHNWWLHTFLGFYEAGLWFPEFKGFSRFAALAPEYFEREMQLLLESDGFTRERSGYHWGTAAHFYDFTSIAEANGVTLSDSFRAGLQRLAAIEWQALAPNGSVPCMGDCGHAHADGKGLHKLRAVAARFGVPEAKFVAEALAPDWQPPYAGMLPAAGRNLLPEYRNLAAREPASPDTVLPASGYYFMRSAWSPDADWLCVEAGPLGAVVHSHDHTHFFNFELYSRGRPVLIDNCSGPYGDSPERRWRVSSAAHNVATLDDRDHLDVLNEWRWGTESLPFVNDWRSEPRFAYFNAAHEAYRRLDAGVASARREIFYLRGEYWVLIDRFTGEVEAEHEYCLHFHVNPPCRLDSNGRLLTAAEGGNLLIVPVPGARGEAALEPCPYPLDGYDNPEHLTYRSRNKGRVLFVTLLAPFADRDAPEVEVRLLETTADGRRVSPWEITALEITLDGRRDVLVNQQMQWNLPWEAGGFRGAQRLFHSRCGQA